MSERTAFGGKTIYGARVGILILDAKHPRIPGDPNNAGTWPFPVLYKVVRQATPGRIIFERGAGLLDAFKAGADELIAQGADGSTATCGFLALFQNELAAPCKVPVATASLVEGAVVPRRLAPGPGAAALPCPALP